MFERFTDRARKAMALCNQEAQRFNHEYVGPEHVLLGLVKEGSGMAATALMNHGIDLRKVRLEVEKLVNAGPDKVVMGRLPQTDQAKKVIEESITAARSLNHNHVGTEHLLLGLLAVPDTIAATVLASLGVTPEVARAEMLTLLAPAVTEPDPSNPLDKLKSLIVGAKSRGDAMIPIADVEEFLQRVAVVKLPVWAMTISETSAQFFES